MTGASSPILACLGNQGKSGWAAPKRGKHLAENPQLFAVVYRGLRRADYDCP
jgi:hypothetical protein